MDNSAVPVWDVRHQTPITTADGSAYMRQFEPVKGQTIVTNAGLGMGKSMNGQRLFRPLLNGLDKHLIISLTSRIVQTTDEKVRFAEDFSSKGDDAFRTDPLLRPGADGCAKGPFAIAPKKVSVYY